ncbi:MAG: hypothetical protein Tsb006_4550 [Rickettsiaceae bacterium]
MAKSNSDNDDIFGIFTGKWNIARTIHKHSDKSVVGTVTGTACFYPQPDSTILLHEKLEVTWENSTTAQATKSYLFKKAPGTIIQYRFETPIDPNKNTILTTEQTNEKIEMHQLNFIGYMSSSVANATYLCGSDEYKLRFEVRSGTHFTMDYEVLGEGKSCYIHTEFNKLNEHDSDQCDLLGDSSSFGDLS